MKRLLAAVSLSAISVVPLIAAAPAGAQEWKAGQTATMTFTAPDSAKRFRVQAVVPDGLTIRTATYEQERDGRRERQISYEIVRPDSTFGICMSGIGLERLTGRTLRSARYVSYDRRSRTIASGSGAHRSVRWVQTTRDFLGERRTKFVVASERLRFRDLVSGARAFHAVSFDTCVSVEQGRALATSTRITPIR